MKFGKYLINEAKKVPLKPTESDINFIITYVKDHNRDFGGDIPTTRDMAIKAHKAIRKNCNAVEDMYYEAMKQYFT